MISNLFGNTRKIPKLFPRLKTSWNIWQKYKHITVQICNSISKPKYIKPIYTIVVAKKIIPKQKLVFECFPTNSLHLISSVMLLLIGWKTAAVHFLALTSMFPAVASTVVARRAARRSFRRATPTYCRWTGKWDETVTYRLYKYTNEVFSNCFLTGLCDSSRLHWASLRSWCFHLGHISP